MNLNLGLLHHAIMVQKVFKKKIDAKIKIKSEFFNLQFQLLKVRLHSK